MQTTIEMTTTVAATGDGRDEDFETSSFFNDQKQFRVFCFVRFFVCACACVVCVCGGRVCVCVNSFLAPESSHLNLSELDFLSLCVLYCTVLYCTVLYCTVLYCNLLCGASHQLKRQYVPPDRS
jgi:hypothetical protein